MVTFREYLLEYVKDKDKSLFFGISKMKHGNNGKDWNNPHGRKHINTVPIEYNHKHPIINSICQGKADNIQVTGANLNNILNLYNMVFEVGLKTIGNSDVEIEMFEDEESRQFGKLRNKKKVQPNGL